MGQVVKQVSNHSTRYYWYPGEKKEWLRGVIALATGVAAYVLLHVTTHSTVLAAVVGTSLATGAAGFNFGRRDSRELARFADLAKSKYVRRQAAVHTGRAVWRGIAEGTGGAAAAVLIANLAEGGILANWLLPLVPAVIGALAHQSGMMYERLGTSQSTDGPAKRADGTPVAAEPAPTVPADPDARAVGSARVPVKPLSATAAAKLLPSAAGPEDAPETVVRFDPVADCGTVVSARDRALAAMPARRAPANDRAANDRAANDRAANDKAANDRAANDKAANVTKAAGATKRAGDEIPAGKVPAAKVPAAEPDRVLTSHHSAIALPASVSTFTHGKPPMPLSAALAARSDLAHLAAAFGPEALTESRKYSAK
jgi:hypothetical protein